MPDSVKLRKVLGALHCLGFKRLRQKGSHAFFEHADGRATVIPLHDKIKIGLLLKIIKKDLNMEKEEFFKLLE